MLGTAEIAPPSEIAFIGLGVMGAAMAANLHRAGFGLTVPTRSHAKAAALEWADARWADTPAAAAARTTCTCRCVPNTAAVEAVLFDPDGVAHGIARRAVVIDLSVIAATAAAAFAAQRKASHHLALLDNPVSGAREI